MAAGAWKVYGSAAEKVAKGTLDLDGAVFRLILTGTGYTPNQNTHGTWADVSANEITGTGYTANGKLITQAVTRSNLVTTFDCDDQSWAASTITGAKWAVLVRDADANGALAAGDDLLAYFELEVGGTVSTTAAALTITMNAGGLFTLTAS